MIIIKLNLIYLAEIRRNDLIIYIVTSQSTNLILSHRPEYVPIGLITKNPLKNKHISLYQNNQCNLKYIDPTKYINVVLHPPVIITLLTDNLILPDGRIKLKTVEDFPAGHMGAQNRDM